MFGAIAVVIAIGGCLIIVAGMGFMFAGDYLNGVVSMLLGIGCVAGFVPLMKKHLKEETVS